MGGSEVWVHSFVLARQVLYHFSHTLTSFCFSFFSYRVLHFFSWDSLWPQFSLGPTYSFLCGWDYRNTPPYPVCLLRWSLGNVLFRLASDCDLPCLHLLSYWHYKCDHCILAKRLKFILIFKYTFFRMQASRTILYYLWIQVKMSHSLSLGTTAWITSISAFT